MRAIVERDGLASASKRFGKPDSQINDMLAGRKSFGEKVARDMESKYSPDRPAGFFIASKIYSPVGVDLKFTVWCNASPRNEQHPATPSNAVNRYGSKAQ